MTVTNREGVRVVAFQDSGMWIAQCVEYDICVQGADLAQAKRRMKVALDAEARFTESEYGEAFKNIDPAPDFYEAIYDSAEESLQGEEDFRIAA